MLKCQDIVARASSIVDDDLTIMQKINVKIHLFMCLHCRRFIHQFKLFITSSQFLASPELTEDEAQAVVDRVRNANQ